MKNFVHIIVIGVTLTLCHGGMSVFLLKRDAPAMHIPLQNPQKADEVAAHEESEKPLIIDTNKVLKDVEASKAKDGKEVAGDVPLVKPLNSSVTTKPAIVNETVAGKLPGDFDAGALKRGSLVFLGLCVVVLLCYAWKTYRLRKYNSSPVMVHKYGVRANRSDIEMRPLPMDEEEDDDTLFEIGNNTNRQ